MLESVLYADRRLRETAVDQIDVIQDYFQLIGKTYTILLSSLEDGFNVSLSMNEKVVLQVLDAFPLPIKEVGLRTGLASSTLSNVIDSLADKNILVKRPSAIDKRYTTVELAELGEQIQLKLNSVIRQICTVLVHHFQEQDREELVRLTKSLTDFLRGDTTDLGEETLIEQFKRGRNEIPNHR
jgi:DNA-binding MarR family transcriptional regulator